MKVIVLHDRYNNELIIFRISAINVIKRCFYIYDENKKEEYTTIVVGTLHYDVKEPIDVVMMIIRAAESEDLNE